MKSTLRTRYRTCFVAGRMAIRWWLLGLIGFAAAGLEGRSQGTLKITFDQPPMVPPGGSVTSSQYEELGLLFKRNDPLFPGDGVLRYGGGYYAHPDNGTAYLMDSGGTNMIVFSRINGAVFDLVLADLAEAFAGPSAILVNLNGYRDDGTVLSAEFTTDGINDGTGPLMDFQTFSFAPAWTGLSRVEIPSHGWALDNLVVYIPEPNALALLAVGSGLLWAARRSMRRRM